MTMGQLLKAVLSFTLLAVAAVLLRFVLIAYGDWQVCCAYFAVSLPSVHGILQMHFSNIDSTV